ncbi:MAG: dinitrogenase iron-molybdenum cofactor biosynthesis protein [Anaerolineae bacterium]|nr:dinitrogenase iron-molybdenum cofactor biosynthesis protein [Anaerolineae bacterium]
MKIAVVTDDGTTISQHFGRAAFYLVFTIEDNAITAKELIDKPGHRQFAQLHDDPDHDQHDHEHEHDHDHEQGHDHGHHHDERGHGFGPGPDHKHNLMIEPVADCAAVIVRGMGRGAHVAFAAANITAILTLVEKAEDAVKAYIEGTLDDNPDRLH